MLSLIERTTVSAPGSVRRAVVRSLASTLVVTALLAFAGESASAAVKYDTPEQCIASANFSPSPVRCRSDGGGKWYAIYDEPSSGPSGGFGGFLLLAILWGAAPAVIGGMIASSRGQSVGIAVLLGIVLGWIGLLIVAFLLKPEVTAAARNVVDNASRSAPQISPSQSTRRDTAERLSELDALRSQGLISNDEHASRRRAILNEI